MKHGNHHTYEEDVSLFPERENRVSEGMAILSVWNDSVSLFETSSFEREK
jgi:hypothetical protein